MKSFIMLLFTISSYSMVKLDISLVHNKGFDSSLTLKNEIAESVTLGIGEVKDIEISSYIFQITPEKEIGNENKVVLKTEIFQKFENKKVPIGRPISSLMVLDQNENILNYKSKNGIISLTVLPQMP